MADGILANAGAALAIVFYQTTRGAGTAASPLRWAVLLVDWLLLSHFGEFFFQGLDFGHLALGLQFFQPGKVHV